MPSPGWTKRNARRHGHYSGPSGHKVGKFEAGRFVAWDGEGSYRCACAPDADGRRRSCPHTQAYVYMANSEGGELVQEDGIDTRTGLAALVGEAKRLGPTATHVCFGLSYDANMLLRDLPRPALRALWEGSRVRFARRFKIAYRPRKSLWVKDYDQGASVGIWDTFGFHQSSFVRAVEKMLGMADPRLPLVRAGKARRDEFRLTDLPFIRRYTGAELSCLVDLCGKLRESFIDAGLTLKRWDGAGAAAGALFDRERVKDHLADVPPEVATAGRFAYSGGRIEVPLYGYYDGLVVHKDIRSAYPAAAVPMPSLAHGRWRSVDRREVPSEPFSVVKVRWDFGRLGDGWDVLPFSFRSSTGSIYFPRKGTSWAWRPEVDAALAWPDLRRRIDLLGGWEFVPDDPNDKPFRFFEDIYKVRSKMKADKRGGQLALKLGSNSGYGKLAQNVGGREGKPPPYHQLEYAGFITSSTRARLFTVARQVPGSVIALATDGIYATEPIAGLDEEDRLGAWEPATHVGMLVAQSGVYWLVNEAKAGGARCDKCDGRVEAGPLGTWRCVDPVCGWSNLSAKYRGFDEDSLNPDAILAAWRRRETTVTAESTRFVTIGRATLTETAFAQWRRWVTEERVLDIRATGKRTDRPSTRGRAVRPDRGLVPTDPADPFERVSTAYEPKWAAERGDEAAAAQEAASLR